MLLSALVVIAVCQLSEVSRVELRRYIFKLNGLQFYFLLTLRTRSFSFFCVFSHILFHLLSRSFDTLHFASMEFFINELSSLKSCYNLYLAYITRKYTKHWCSLNVYLRTTSVQLITARNEVHICLIITPFLQCTRVMVSLFW